MIRIRFEMLPGGNEEKARTIGLMEICNIGCKPDGTADYAVVLTKTPPFRGALKQAWRKGRVGFGEGAIETVAPGEDEEAFYARVSGHHRTKRGIYDLAFRALEACGLGRR